jgi:chromosome segregation ATPase
MAGLLLTTGCVKNEEADGVKALREAQAELIKAKAQHETALDEADAAYRTAEAALKQAEVAYKNAQTDGVKLQNALLQAQVDVANAKTEVEKQKAANEVEKLKMQLEILKAEQQGKMDKAVAEAEAALNQAKIKLEQSKRALEAEIAKSKSLNPTLSEYMAKYNAAINLVENYRSVIVEKQKTIAGLNLQKDFGDLSNAGFEEYLTNALAQRQRDLAKVKDWKEKYKAVYADPSTLQSAINEQRVRLSQLEDDQKEKAEEIEAAADAIEDAKQVRTDAGTDYSDAMDWVDDIDALSSDDLTAHVDVDEDIAEDLLNKPQSGSRTVFSLVHYTKEISDKADALLEEQETLVLLNKQLTAVKDLYKSYKGKLDAAQTARDNAKIKYHEALANYNKVYLANGGDNTAAAVKTAQTAMNNAEASFTTADNNLKDLKSDINNAILETGTIDENDAADWYKNYYKKWVGDNDKEIQDAIEQLEETDIPKQETEVADAEEDLNDAKADETLANAYLAYCNNQLGGDPDATIKTLKDKYYAAKADVEKAEKAKEALDDEKEAIDDDVKYVKDFLGILDSGDNVGLEDTYSQITSKLDDFDHQIAGLNQAIASLQKTIKEGADALEYLANRIAAEEENLADLKEKLSVSEKEADYYLDLINAELGTK